MTDAPLKMVFGRPGDDKFELCMQAIDAMRSACAELVMTAAAIFSGMQAWTMMSVGAFAQGDRKRLTDAAAVNFRQGIKFGLDRGLQVGADLAGGGVQ